MEWQTIVSLLGMASLPVSVAGIWIQYQGHRRAEGQDARDRERLLLAEAQDERDEARLSVDLMKRIEELESHAQRCDEELERAKRDRSALAGCQRQRDKLTRQLAAARAAS